MKVNPKLRAVLDEIAKDAVTQANTPARNYKHYRRLLRVFNSALTEQERIYIVSTIFEMIHYKNVMVDPDNLLTISNIKLRTILFTFLLGMVFLVSGALLFRSNHSLKGIVNMIDGFMKIFSL